jgi:hypothetical protein
MRVPRPDVCTVTCPTLLTWVHNCPAAHSIEMQKRLSETAGSAALKRIGDLVRRLALRREDENMDAIAIDLKGDQG